MDDQQHDEVPSETPDAWDTARRLREPAAWTLLVLTAINVLIGVWGLFGLPGAPAISAPTPVLPDGSPIPAPVTNFGLRASVVAPQFVAGAIFLLPILAIILVAFAGGLTGRARQVVQAAISIQGVALVLGVLSWLGALGAHPRTRTSIFFFSDATALAVMAVALIFAVALMRSRALRLPARQLEDLDEDDEDWGEDDEDSGEDEDRARR
jgi:hypothetical protein